MEASDQGTPERKATMTIYITVRRSTRAPRFDDTPYNVQRISETKRVGENVFKVRAHDPDLMEKIKFEITGDYPAPSFFSVNTNNGQISIKSDLKTDNLKSTLYKVCRNASLFMYY